MKKRWCVTVVVLSVAGIAAVPLANAQARKGPPRKNGNQGPPSVSVRPPDSRRLRTSLTAPLGWYAGIASNAIPGLTFWEAAAKADGMGLASVEGVSTQKVSADIAKSLDYHLSESEVDAVKHRLAELRLRMPAYYVPSIGPDETSRKVFEFAKSLGVTTIVSTAETASLPALDQLASETGVNLALDARDPKHLAGELQGRSERMGAAADLDAWAKAGIKPADALGVLKGRVMVVNFQTPGALGAKGIERFLVELSRVEEPASLVSPSKCTNCSRPLVGLKPVFLRLDPAAGADPLTDLTRQANAFDAIIRIPMGDRVDRIARATPITSPDEVPADERRAIEAGLPREALAKPKKPRKLLVIDLCPAGGYYHATIAHANLAIGLLAKYTGAFEPTFSNDLDNLKYPKIKQWDAVFLNSVVGELFTDPEVLGGLERFVREGGGVAGIHGSTYASMDLPDYGELMGAQDGPHRVEPATLKVEDPNSPLTKAFAASEITKEFGGKEFKYVDEFYHFLPTGPFSREKLHVLISVDTAKSDMTEWQGVRPDNDYGLVWIKTYGKGRVFNCAMGHTPTLFATRPLATMILGGIQYVLGDLEADATPSAKLAARR